MAKEDQQQLADIDKEPFDETTTGATNYMEVPSSQRPHLATSPDVEPGLHYVTFDADVASISQPSDCDEHGPYVTMLFQGDMSKLISSYTPSHDECVALRVYIAPLKTAVVEKEIDNLTPEDYHKYHKEVRAAILEELRVWIDHKCFHRRPRYGARNVLDVRWVGRWKRVKSKSNPGENVRIIRMRMTLRGLKDADAGTLTTFAGTSSRLGQRLVVSEACCRGWPMAALDIKKGFLERHLVPRAGRNH